MNLWHNCITHIVSVGDTVLILMVLTAPKTDGGGTRSQLAILFLCMR